MEDVREFKYLDSVLCKHNSMEGNTVIEKEWCRVAEQLGTWEVWSKGRSMSFEVKRDPLKNWKCLLEGYPPLLE